MSPDIERNRPSNDDLVRELEALRVENNRLRRLLGLDHRPDDGHTQEWTPTLFAGPTERRVVDS